MFSAKHNKIIVKEYDISFVKLFCIVLILYFIFNKSKTNVQYNYNLVNTYEVIFNILIIFSRKIINLAYIAIFLIVFLWSIEKIALSTLIIHSISIFINHTNIYILSLIGVLLQITYLYTVIDLPYFILYLTNICIIYNTNQLYIIRKQIRKYLGIKNNRACKMIIDVFLTILLNMLTFSILEKIEKKMY